MHPTSKHIVTTLAWTTLIVLPGSGCEMAAEEWESADVIGVEDGEAEDLEAEASLAEEGVGVEQQALVSTNLLLNPGFESGCTSWVGTPACAVVTTPVHSGTRAASRSLSYFNTGLYQTVAAIAGRTYEASSWLTTSSGSSGLGCLTRLGFLNSAGTFISTVSSAKARPATWSQQVVYGTAPTGTVSARAIVVCDYGLGTAYFDDLALGERVVSPPASVTTGAATYVDGNAATLAGSANPNGAPTTAWFRYAATSPGSCNDTFGTRLPGLGLGSGTATIGYSQTATGLAPGTTYYYCAVAQNQGGTRFGSLRTFFAPYSSVRLVPANYVANSGYRPGSQGSTGEIRNPSQTFVAPVTGTLTSLRVAVFYAYGTASFNGTFRLSSGGSVVRSATITPSAVASTSTTAATATWVTLSIAPLGVTKGAAYTLDLVGPGALSYSNNYYWAAYSPSTYPSGTMYYGSTDMARDALVIFGYTVP